MKNLPLKISNSLFKILIEIFIFDKNKRARIKSRWAKFHLNKYVNKAIKNYKPQEKQENQNIIWQYWHQGEENAPELVKKCLESVKKYESDRKIVVLSYDTIKDYIDLPKIYHDLLEQGKMKIAHFSDIVRVYLLTTYGGCWIDSTLYLSDKIPEDITNSDFCVLQKDPRLDNQENIMSCFFIQAKNNSINLNLIKNSLENYWSGNNFVINYFMFEHISTLLKEKSEELASEWRKMPFYSAEDSGKLQEIMFEDFDEVKWNKIISKTCIHKLSYKNINDKEISKKSYYNKILEDM